MDYKDYWIARGFPWEHDPGPPKNLSWSRLFAATPNYRAIAENYMNDDKFRWHFGPMYYRGRLEKGKVKVLIIGQEGAMDESLAHRSFVGFSGAVLQYLLDYIGIDYQYLFLNTFVYPIHGQYTERKIKILGQDQQSPIVIHRHKILDYVLSKNDIQLIIAVGNAAKESVCTWIESHGGHCPDGIQDLTTSESHVLGANTKAIGIIHPGALQDASNAANVLANYQQTMTQIQSWINQNPNWLPVDEGMSRNFSIPVQIGHKKIPFRDLPAGISWRIGNGNSTSKRGDGQRTIEIESEIPPGSAVSANYHGLSKGNSSGYMEGVHDVPYEPPVDEHDNYDKGPTESFLKLIMGGYPGLEWPDFTGMGISAHPSFGWLPLFRGRPDESNILVLADQQSVDDLFTMRALTGDSGQHFQKFLTAAGIKEKYCIIRSLPVDSSGVTLNQRKNIVAHAQVVKVYQAIIQKVLNYDETEVILVMGPVSQHLWNKMNLNVTQPVFKMKNKSQNHHVADWQYTLDQLSSLHYQKELVPNYQYSGEREQIPRGDLPYGFLRWQGTSGDRAQRPKNNAGIYSSYHYKWFVPDWVYTSQPKPLTQEEQQLINQLPP